MSDHSIEKKQPTIPLSAIQEMGFHSGQAFALLRTTAEFLSKSNIIPTQFQGNLPNCAIALNMAQRMGADPLMLMQNMDVIYNRPAFRAKFLIATFNVSGAFSKIHYEWQDRDKPYTDGWACRAFAAEKATGEVLYGPWITWKMVKAEGWDKKQGSKWNTIPELMFMYRAGAWFINTHSPEISMGLRTVEEEEDIQATTATNVTGQAQELERTPNMPPAYPGRVSDETPQEIEQKEPEAPKPPEAPKSTSAPKGKGSSTPKPEPPAAPATQGNPAYSDQEPDPFAPGGDLFGK